MSAFVVDREHVDVLVRAAMHYGETYSGSRFQWWRADEDGDASVYCGWRALDPRAESYAGSKDTEGYMEHVSPSMAGQLLVSANVASVSYRYSEPGRTVYYGAEAAGEMEDDTIETLPGPCDRYYMGPYVYRDPGYVLTPGEVFAAIDCLDYQSCEHPTWATSEAYSFLRFLRDAACRAVAREENAPREWDAEELRKRRGVAV